MARSSFSVSQALQEQILNLINEIKFVVKGIHPVGGVFRSARWSPNRILAQLIKVAVCAQPQWLVLDRLLRVVPPKGGREIHRIGVGVGQICYPHSFHFGWSAKGR